MSVAWNKEFRTRLSELYSTGMSIDQPRRNQAEGGVMQLSDLPNVGVWYIASPYTKYDEGIWPAYKEVARIAGRLVAAGLNVFSPIAHTHPLAIYGQLDSFDHALWMRVGTPFWALCGGLIIAKMDGWKESKGIAAEYIEFSKAGKPIFYLDPATLKVAPTTSTGVAA